MTREKLDRLLKAGENFTDLEEKIGKNFNWQWNQNVPHNETKPFHKILKKNFQNLKELSYISLF